MRSDEEIKARPVDKTAIGTTLANGWHDKRMFHRGKYKMRTIHNMEELRALHEDKAVYWKDTEYSIAWVILREILRKDSDSGWFNKKLSKGELYVYE